MASSSRNNTEVTCASVIKEIPEKIKLAGGARHVTVCLDAGQAFSDLGLFDCT